MEEKKLEEVTGGGLRPPINPFQTMHCDSYERMEDTPELLGRNCFTCVHSPHVKICSLGLLDTD